MVSCILPYYIHRQIYRCMNIYIQTYILYIQTFENPLVHSRTYILIAYIHTLQLSSSSILWLVFLRVAFLLLFLFLNFFRVFIPSRLGYSLSTITILFLQMKCNLKRFKCHGALHRKWSSRMVFLKVMSAFIVRIIVMYCLMHYISYLYSSVFYQIPLEKFC